MNTLKPMLIFAVLIGVCYGVYSRINHKPSSPPPEAMVHWDNTEPTVQMPEGMNGPGEHKSPGPLGTSFMGSSLPTGASLGAGQGGGNSGGAPGSATYTLGPGGASGNPPGATASDSQPAAWDPSAGGGAVAGQYGAPSQSGPAGPSAVAPGGQGYDPYGQPPAAGQDGSYGQAIPPAAGGAQMYPPGASEGQMYPPGVGDPAMASGAGSYPPGSDPGHAAAMTPFGAALEQARHELDAGRLSEAHYQLSRWYDDPNLAPQESRQLNELLDQLAGTVIYSTQNLMEPACEVQQGETLERIAQRYNVPWQLLAKINGIDDPRSLRPGERLKVVRGPFSAVISLERHTLTLMLNNAYAGRFPISVGHDSPPPEGQYFIDSKQIDPIYYGPGRTVGPRDPNNPLGRRWIGLGQQFGIHGTNDQSSIGRDDVPGSISMADRDIDDVFDILSEGSKVVVRR